MTASRAESPAHPAPREHLVSPWTLWFGLFGAPAAWAIQLITDYALLSHFCYPVDTPLAAPTFGGVRSLAIVISAALLITALAALLVAVHAWRETRRETSDDARRQEHRKEAAEIGEGRTRFMAMAGVVVSGIFVYGILMVGLPLLTMNPCTL